MHEWKTILKNPPVTTLGSIHPDVKTKWEVQGVFRLLLCEILIAELLLSSNNFSCVLAGWMPNRAGYLCSSLASRDKGIYAAFRKMCKGIRYDGDIMWEKHWEIVDHRLFQLASFYSVILREFLLVPAHFCTLTRLE